jgi:hypothetical protein
VTTRVFYRGYLLSCQPSPVEQRFQARVVITALGGDKTRSQRFLDLETFDSEAAAIERAHEAGIQWIDANDRQPIPTSVTSHSRC